MAKLTHTVSGNNVTSFRSADIANIESLKCHFLPVQEGSGDPSPENVRPIMGWNGIQIQHINKNFIKKYYTTSTENRGLTIIPTERGIHISGTAIVRTACMLSDTNHIPFKTNDKVTFSLYFNGDISQCENPYVGYYKKVGVYGNATGSLRTDNNYTFTWTVPSAYGDTDESYIDSYIYIPEGVTVDFEIGLQAELASTLSNFEPHKESIIPIIFPTTGKNKLNPNTISIQANFELVNNIYKNIVADTRTSCQLEIQLYKNTTYIKSAKTISNVPTGRFSMTFMVDHPECSHLVFKYNGLQKDFRIRFSLPLGLRQYTISCDVLSNDPTTIGGVQLTNIQLEVGDTATGYEPYIENLNNTIYGGYVDIAKGEIVETHKKKILNGTETWSGYRTASDPGCHFVITLSDKKIGLNGTISDTFPNANNIYFWDRDDLPSQFGDHGTLRNLYFNAPYPMTNGIAEWKQWLSEHNVTIVYPLETPIHYPILKQNIASFLNQNNIWSNANDIIEVEYSIIDHLLQKRMNIPKLTSKVIWNQLVYPQKRNGPVVTSSGDGVFHVTVTMASTDYYTLTSSDHYMTIIAGHKYYLRGCPVTDGSIWFLTTNGNNGNQNDKGYGTVATFNKSSDTVRTQIRLEPGTYDFYIKPIIVDLTQMFGAGNEPTKEEFEQLCKYNGIDLAQVQPFDLGTEKIWYINNYEITKYKTVEWNQLDPMLNSSNWEVYNSSYASVSFDDGVATRTVLQDAPSSYSAAIRTKFVVNTDTTHKYYIKQELYSSVAKTYVLTLGANWCRQFAVPAEEWTVCEVIGAPISSEKIYAIYDGNNGNLSLAGYTCKLRNPLVIDLTQMFGAGNEPTLQEFRALCTANGVNLDSALPRDTGTKQLWII